LHGGGGLVLRRDHRLTGARAALLGAGLALTGCASLTGEAGLVDGRLRDCPPAPHCVSSLATGARHRIEPVWLLDPQQGWARLVETVRASDRTTVVSADDRYVHAEVASPWRVYTDDLELLRSDGGRVDVRSTSRLGYYDFNVNRERVEALRRRLAEAGAIRSP
jgi:uncharacterized protein (DUF1499 family)